MALSSVDYSHNVTLYSAPVDRAAVRGIARHLGRTLLRRDLINLTESDPAERRDLREHFLKRRLRLAHADAELDAAIEAVIGRMNPRQPKSRVTVCYLLAERFDKLRLFL
ncbi:MAG: DUF2853 family protein [Vicinamibacterales bacterium]